MSKLTENTKPIILKHVYADGETFSQVWCPQWGPKPDLDKAKAEGKLIETNEHFLITTKDPEL